MALSLTLERQHGQLVIRNRIIPVARYVVGIPILLGGLALGASLVSSLVTGLREGGVDALLTAFTGAWLLALFTLMTLPLGWWLTFGQRYVVIEPQGPTVAEVTTWLVGRRVQRTPAAAFRAVRVAVEPLNQNTSEGNQGSPTLCQQLRLLARDPQTQTSFDLGALELDARAEAVAAATQIAGALGLPLEVTDPGERLLSPERATTLAEDEARLDD